MKDYDVKMGGDLSYCLNKQESMMELNTIIQILKLKKRLPNAREEK
jgi:hypothetical protein